MLKGALYLYFETKEDLFRAVKAKYPEFKLHALSPPEVIHLSRMSQLPVREIEMDYGRRPEGSHSKLSTFRDGFKILWMFAMLAKETRPMRFTQLEKKGFFSKLFGG